MVQRPNVLLNLAGVSVFQVAASQPTLPPASDTSTPATPVAVSAPTTPKAVSAAPTAAASVADGSPWGTDMVFPKTVDWRSAWRQKLLHVCTESSAPQPAQQSQSDQSTDDGAASSAAPQPVQKSAQPPVTLITALVQSENQALATDQGTVSSLIDHARALIFWTFCIICSDQNVSE